MASILMKTKRGQWQGGKGSTRRNSNEKAYADNWEAIFGKKAKKDKDIKEKK